MPYYLQLKFFKFPISLKTFFENLFEQDQSFYLKTEDEKVKEAIVFFLLTKQLFKQNVFDCKG